MKEIWENLKRRIMDKVCKKIIRIKKRKIGKREWWNAECKRRKRMVKKLYRDWKRGTGVKEKNM